MDTGLLPSEVELAFDIMPCQAMRTAQEPGQTPHPCSYFRKWGTYHSYGYETDGPPPKPGVLQTSQYLGRGPLVPEMLSGCRKAPIMAVGINPNLPGWWPATRNSVNPLFDVYRQYAHYFRYRETAKLDIPQDKYKQYVGTQTDSPFSKVELNVPKDEHGFRTIPLELQRVAMYENYQSLLDDLATAMKWPDDHKLIVGEDVSYGNMVACPSAKWINRPDPKDPAMPPMTSAQQRGIVAECFHHRRYFLRQLFQALPRVIMVFSQSTADAFLAEMAGQFSAGDPHSGDDIDDLLDREIRLKLGTAPNGATLEARVIFSPHITGDPQHFAQARAKVLAQLVAEAKAKRLGLDATTGHLNRSPGGCVFCTMLQIGPCDYEKQLVPLANIASLTADSPPAHFAAENEVRKGLLRAYDNKAQPTAAVPVELTIQKPVARAAATEVASAALMRAEKTASGWDRAGDPARQADREING